MSLPGYDAWATGGRFQSDPVEVTCVCGNSWLDSLETEYGAGSLTVHEECPVCLATGDALMISPTNPDDWDPRL